MGQILKHKKIARFNHLVGLGLGEIYFYTFIELEGELVLSINDLCSYSILYFKSRLIQG